MIRFLLALSAALLLAAPLRAQVDVTEVTSPGGIEAWLVEEPAIPFVALELRFVGGASVDPEGQEGAARMMAALLDQGAGGMDELEYAAAVESVAASFSFSASQDAVSVSARFLSESQAESVDLLRAALIEPRFDPAPLERTRARMISSIRSNERSPNHLASRAFDRLAWGDHAYARPADGTIESVTALSRADIEAAHDRAFARDRLLVAAVGDIGPQELGALLDRLLGALPEEGVPLPPYARAGMEAGVTVIPFDGPQSVIAFGHGAIRRDDPQFFAAYVMNEVLGGGRFSTRLMSELRERRGLTYGAGTALATQQFGDSIQGRFSTANATAGEAVTVVREEWERMAREGMSAAELDAIKTYLTGAYPLRFDGNGAIARILVGMQMQGDPPEYMDTRNDRIMAVSLEDVRDVAARLLDPSSLHFVVVGQPEGLEDAIPD